MEPKVSPPPTKKSRVKSRSPSPSALGTLPPFFLCEANELCFISLQTNIVLMMIHPLIIRKPVLTTARSQHHLQEGGAQNLRLRQSLNPHIRNNNLAQGLLCQGEDGLLHDPEGAPNPVLGHQGDDAQDHLHEKGPNPGHVLDLQREGGQRVLSTPARESLDQGSFWWM